MRSKIYIIVMGLCLFFFFFSSCGRKEAPKADKAKAAGTSAEDAQASLKQKVLAFNLEGFTQKGTKSWDVKGESAEAISENQIKLDNIVATAYGEEAEAVITADKGIYDKTKNNVMLEQNVKATIENSEVFADEYVDPTTALLAPDKPKRAESPERKKSRIIITCDGAVEFNYERNQVYFNDNVKVISEDGTINSDKITVNLDPETKKLTDIIAEGNVKITKGDNVTYSDKAMYVESEKKIVLIGRPKLVIQQDGDLGSGFLSN